MNRAERRKRSASGGEPVYTLKKSQIDQMVHEAFERAREVAIDEAFLLLMAIPAKVMHEKYGWGIKRLSDFAEAVADEYQLFADGEMTADEYREYVYQECGIKFTANE